MLSWLNLVMMGLLAAGEWYLFPQRYDDRTTATSVAWFALGTVTAIPAVYLEVPLFGWCIAHAVHVLKGWPALLVFDDFSMYWSHRFSHAWAPWWFGHRVHHSSTKFNFLVALRASPVEAAFVVPFLCVPLLLGVSLKMLALERFLSLAVQHLMHTRVRWEGPAWLRALFVTPAFHELHHASNECYWDRNFGAVLSCWDRLFGTSVRYSEEPVYGVR